MVLKWCDTSKLSLERVSKVMDDNLYSELYDKAEKMALFLVHFGGGSFKFEDA